MLLGEASGQMIECYLYVDHISMFNRTFFTEGAIYRQINIQRNADNIWKQAWMPRLPSGPRERLSFTRGRLLMTFKDIAMDTVSASENHPNSQSSLFFMVLNDNICSLEDHQKHIK